MGVGSLLVAVGAVGGREVRGTSRADVVWTSEVAGEESQRALDDLAMALGVLGETFGDRPTSPWRMPDHVHEVEGIVRFAAVT